MCPEVRGIATCLESFIAPPGVPFELPVLMDECVCCAETSCSVEVGDVLGQPTLRLTTGLCPDPCDCDVCSAAEATCAVPPLDAGFWHVVVNGAPAFELPVVFDSGVVPPPAACVSYASPDVCAVSPGPPSYRSWQPETYCLTNAWGGPIAPTITVISECWPCGDLQGPCVVSLEPRTTDDLPPGGELRIGPSAHPNTCLVDCPDICNREERVCVLPELRPGDFYRVWSSDGRELFSFEAGATSDLCVPESPIPVPG